ncbi:hypothetical protein Gotur_005582, partial [Gossypium turneri]
AEDRILQCHIHNLLGPPSPLIEPYLREVGFWHVALMYTFHFPHGECTITLEDVHLQLWLPVDESVVTGSIQSADWGAVCGDILGAASEMIYGGRIEMAWIRKNFVGLVEDSTKVQRERYAEASERTQLGIRRVGDIIPRDVSGDATRKNQNWWLPFTTTIMGLVLVSIFTSSSKLLVYIPTRNKTAYKNPTIREVIPEEFFVNPNAWHVKVSLVVYATVKMHKTDKFKIHGKPYLYEEEARRRQPHTSRPRRPPLNSKAGNVGPLSAPTQKLALTTLAPILTPPPVQYVSSYSNAYYNCNTFNPYPSPEQGYRALSGFTDQSDRNLKRFITYQYS